MLVLTRKPGEKVMIGDNVTLTVVEVKGNRVRLAFEAPAQVTIYRSELIGWPARQVVDGGRPGTAGASRSVEWEEPAPELVIPR